MVIHLIEKKIYGRKIRTNNRSTNEIVALWQQVKEQDLQGDMYAVYSNYATNYTGDYDLLIGNELDNGSTAQLIFTGKYLEIPVLDNTIAGVAEAWNAIWKDTNLEQTRKYTCDFEQYKTDGTCSIFLSVHETVMH